MRCQRRNTTSEGKQCRIPRRTGKTQITKGCRGPSEVMSQLAQCRTSSHQPTSRTSHASMEHEHGSCSRKQPENSQSATFSSRTVNPNEQVTPDVLGPQNAVACFIKRAREPVPQWRSGRHVTSLPVLSSSSLLHEALWSTR